MAFRIEDLRVVPETRGVIATLLYEYIVFSEDSATPLLRGTLQESTGAGGGGDDKTFGTGQCIFWVVPDGKIRSPGREAKTAGSHCGVTKDSPTLAS